MQSSFPPGLGCLYGWYVVIDGVYAAYLALCNALLRLPGHRLRVAVLRGIVRAEVGAGCVIERGVQITTKGGLRIGEGTIVNTGTLLDARGGLTIGQRVNISPDVAMLTADHDPQSSSFDGRERPVTIGDSVWLAYRVIVLPGAEIGAGAVVAAGSVVRSAVPARTIVAGNPASRIAERDPGAQAALEPYRRFLH